MAERSRRKRSRCGARRAELGAPRPGAADRSRGAWRIARPAGWRRAPRRSGPQPTEVNRGNDVLGQIFGSKDVSRTFGAERGGHLGARPVPAEEDAADGRDGHRGPHCETAVRRRLQRRRRRSARGAARRQVGRACLGLGGLRSMLDMTATATRSTTFSGWRVGGEADHRSANLNSRCLTITSAGSPAPAASARCCAGSDRSPRCSPVPSAPGDCFRLRTRAPRAGVHDRHR